MEAFRQDFIANLEATLQLLGIPLPTPAYLIGATLFSFVGIYAFVRGQKRKLPVCKWLGIALMVYPLFVPTNTELMYAIGAALSVAFLAFRNK